MYNDILAASGYSHNIKRVRRTIRKYKTLVQYKYIKKLNI